ncbi:uncharacterized protein LOC127590268 [Hippocampus zosterae]|uniref:uncharacterized protein LOC127590268 n=1 Tax=Hippocampus zosterae TaxID=109293 RepID=UPI00223D4B17|nr:uncharacterized protein LOC127590268 [Hippocampus zosterae]
MRQRTRQEDAVYNHQCKRCLIRDKHMLRVETSEQAQEYHVSTATRRQTIQRISGKPFSFASKMNSKNLKGLKSPDVQPEKSGLLYFDETPTSKPNSFEAADSLLDGPIDALGNQSVICTKERKSPKAFSQRPLPPFWTDNMSAWERDDGSPRKEKKTVPEKQLVQWQASSQNNGGSKFRRTVSTKNTSPVNMSKLLSFGYVDEDKPTTSETESSAT